MKTLASRTKIIEEIKSLGYEIMFQDEDLISVCDPETFSKVYTENNRIWKTLDECSFKTFQEAMDYEIREHLL